MNDDERVETEAEAAPYIGREFHVYKQDCCVTVEFTAKLVGPEWERDTYTGGPHKGEDFWYLKGYRFDNGVLMVDGFDPVIAAHDE